MKSKVVLSRFSLIMTLLVSGLLVVGMISSYGSGKFAIIAFVCGFMLFISLWYAPLWVQADSICIEVRTSLRRKKLPYNQIESVSRFYPTMGAMRVMGSGGFCGYWGLFREGDIGLYMAYYGKASDCFLVQMRNGDKFVLGCENSGDVVEYIKSHLNQVA